MGRALGRWLAVLAIAFGCGDDTDVSDAGLDTSSSDVGTEVGRDADSPDVPPDSRFAELPAITPDQFDCRATNDLERRSSTPSDCLLDSGCADPLVVGHRGTGGVFGLYAPENSLSAIRLAILLGVDAVEVDVRHTADDELVLMHDSTLMRTTGIDRDVSEMTLTELREVALDIEGYDGEFDCERVPEFREVLRLARGRIALILDTKTSRGELVAQAVLEEGMLDEAFISVSGVRTAVSAREAVPEVRVQIRPSTVTEYEDMAAMFMRPPEILEVPREQVVNFLDVADRISAKVFVDIFDLDALIYVGGDLSRYSVVYADGADVAQTEFPFWLLEHLGRRTWSTLPTHRPQTLDSPLLPD